MRLDFSVDHPCKDGLVTTHDLVLQQAASDARLAIPVQVKFASQAVFAATL
jgi:hypothetical protein